MCCSRSDLRFSPRSISLGAHDPAEVANLGFGKRIGDGTAYAVERMTDAYQARTIYATVTDIDQALERIEDGTYGRCVSCGNLIPDDRLQAVPWAALCVPCSAKPGKSQARSLTWHSRLRWTMIDPRLRT